MSFDADPTARDNQGDMENKRRRVIVDMRTDIERGPPEGADGVFFAWKESQETSSRIISLETAGSLSSIHVSAIFSV
jgi:hypothetical protein